MDWLEKFFSRRQYVAPPNKRDRDSTNAAFNQLANSEPVMEEIEEEFPDLERFQAPVAVPYELLPGDTKIVRDEHGRYFIKKV